MGCLPFLMIFLGASLSVKPRVEIHLPAISTGKKLLNREKLFHHKDRIAAVWFLLVRVLRMAPLTELHSKGAVFCMLAGATEEVFVWRDHIFFFLCRLAISFLSRCAAGRVAWPPSEWLAAEPWLCRLNSGGNCSFLIFRKGRTKPSSIRQDAQYDRKKK